MKTINEQLDEVYGTPKKERKLYCTDLSKLEKYGFCNSWKDIYQKVIYEDNNLKVALLVNEMGLHDNQFTLYISNLEANEDDKEIDTTIDIKYVYEITTLVGMMLAEGVLEKR